MAASVATQSVFASSFGKGRVNKALTYNYMPRVQKMGTMQVRCMNRENNNEQPSVAKPISPNEQQESPVSQVTPPPTPKVSTKFADIFSFSGPAPERINGRLAMIGFVAALTVELCNGQDVFNQITNGGSLWFLGTSILLSVASLVPLFKGVRADSKSNGVMTSDAELWNGRFAMLGLLALAFTEYLKGGALV